MVNEMRSSSLHCR